MASKSKILDQYVSQVLAETATALDQVFDMTAGFSESTILALAKEGKLIKGLPGRDGGTYTTLDGGRFLNLPADAMATLETNEKNRSEKKNVGSSKRQEKMVATLQEGLIARGFSAEEASAIIAGKTAVKVEPLTVPTNGQSAPATPAETVAPVTTKKSKKKAA